MGLFKKKADPISERARQLEAEIAALEAQIQSLNQKAQPPAPVSTPAHEPVAEPPRPVPAHVPPPPPPAEAPVFEKVNLQRVTAQNEAENPHKFNDLGMRKFDLAEAWRRVLRHFGGPDAHNPRLVNYLASGTIQGLRPLRYERRIARNRFIGLFLLLLLTLWGIAYIFFKHR